jgi:hypothetical protein
MSLTSVDGFASLKGAQEPRLYHFPDGLTLAGEEAIEVAALAGLELDPWQKFFLRNACREKSPGKWSAFEVGLVCPRQNGKGSVLEARELAGLFAFGEKLLIHSAHEQDTSSEHFRRLLNLIESVPEFDQRVLRVLKSNGRESIELRGGQRIKFKTRTGGGGRGLTGDFVALDEAMIIPIATTAALVPTMSARSITGNPQLWYTGSSVDQQKHEHGLVLSRVRARGLNSDDRVVYAEWSAEGDDPGTVPTEIFDNPESAAQANPGLGIRISLEHIANEHAGALGRREYAVERLGIGDWPDPSEFASRMISTEAWAVLADRDSRISGPRVFALDVDPDQTWATIAAAGARDDGQFHVGVVAHRRDIDWVVPLLTDLLERYSSSQLFVDARAESSALIPDLTAAGIRAERINAGEYAQACGGFFQVVTEGRLHYMPPQPELDDAVAGAHTTPLLDAWKWDRKTSTAVITPLVAATIALWGARTKGIPEVYSIAEIIREMEKEGKPEDEGGVAPPEQGIVLLDELPIGRPRVFY